MDLLDRLGPEITVRVRAEESRVVIKTSIQLLLNIQGFLSIAELLENWDNILDVGQMTRVWMVADD
jgi:hypothetical protein